MIIHLLKGLLMNGELGASAELLLCPNSKRVMMMVIKLLLLHVKRG
jgi:hypothetical protein